MSTRAEARASEPSPSGQPDDLIGLANRRLALIQEILGLPQSCFEDREAGNPAAPRMPPDKKVADTLATEAGVRLIERFRRIEDPAVRQGILDLLFSLRALNSSCVR